MRTAKKTKRNEKKTAKQRQLTKAAQMAHHALLILWRAESETGLFFASY